MTTTHAERGSRGWLRFAGFVLAGIAALWLVLVYAGLSVEAPGATAMGEGDQVGWAFDFRTYLGATSRVAVHGSPYDAAVTAGEFSPGGHTYYYTPVLAVALLPLDGLPVGTATAWWYWLHVAALVAACALMPISGTMRLMAFAVAAFSHAVLSDMVMGNVNVLLMSLMVLAWRWLDGPLGSVGVAVGMALRPSLGLLLIWQLLRRAWRAAAWTIGAGLLLVVATAPFVGLHSYFEFLTILGNMELPRNVGASPGTWWNEDLGETVRLLGAGESMMTLARIASLALGFGTMVASLRRGREVGFMVTLMASFLVVPLLWDHYLAMTLLPAAFLAQRLWPPLLLLPILSWLPVPTLLLLCSTIVLLFLVNERAAVPQTGPRHLAVSS